VWRDSDGFADIGRRFGSGCSARQQAGSVRPSGGARGGMHLQQGAPRGPPLAICAMHTRSINHGSRVSSSRKNGIAHAAPPMAPVMNIRRRQSDAPAADRSRVSRSSRGTVPASSVRRGSREERTCRVMSRQSLPNGDIWSFMRLVSQYQAVPARPSKRPRRNDCWITVEVGTGIRETPLGNNTAIPMR
jgi:hypothetical protein